jgi:hypothetical protein
LKEKINEIERELEHNFMLERKGKPTLRKKKLEFSPVRALLTDVVDVVVVKMHNFRG